jgi:hypothetical protein
MEDNVAFSDLPLIGLDVTTPAELLGPGMVTQADNVVWNRGYLETRPGLRGQLAAALTDPTGAGFGFETGGLRVGWEDLPAESKSPGRRDRRRDGHGSAGVWPGGGAG